MKNPLEEGKIAAISEARKEPAVIAVLHSDRITAHVDFSGINGTITRKLIYMGKVIGEGQVKGGEIQKTGLLSKNSTGILSWVGNFFGKSIDHEPQNLDPMARIRFEKLVMKMMQLTHPQEPETWTLGGPDDDLVKVK